MKRNIISLLFLSVLIVLQACSASKGITRQTVQGQWRLDSILYNNIKAHSTIQVFGDVDAACMINSMWTFYGNWDAKIISPMAEGCPTTPQNFVWSTGKEGESNYFGMKPLLAGQKGKQITKGFKIPIQSISEKNMVWNETVQLDYKTSHISYYFTKVTNKAK